MIIALAGNQNSGKTTLFNALTGSNRHVGNFPGVTVEKKIGKVKDKYGNDTYVVDLPGVYSLTPYSSEERAAYDYLMCGEADCIVAVCDAVCPARSLYLALLLAELNIPTVIALNMYDILLSKNGSMNTELLSKKLGIPVIPLSAAKGEGINDLISAVKTVQKAEKPKPKSIDVSETEIEKKYRYIDGLLRNCFTEPKENRKSFTVRADSVVCGKVFALPFFALVMFALFYITFSIFGADAAQAVNDLFSIFSQKSNDFLLSLSVSKTVVSLVCDGVICGIGSVLSFLPTVTALYFLISLLEDSGYMARVAFIFDRPMRVFGLSGRDAVPLLMGFGCSVPAILAARTSTSDESRRRTVYGVPFFSCSAKIPVYSLVLSSFFPQTKVFLLIMIYFTGIAFGLLTLCIRRSDKKPPYMLELPEYRLPRVKNTVRGLLDKVGDFVKRAFTVIFVASVVCWVLSHFSLRMTYSVGQNSILMQAGKLIAPLLAPMGLNDPCVVAALISGLFAKEAVVSTLSVLLGTNGPASVMTRQTAIPFLLFTLLYPPCAATFAATKKELGSFGKAAAQTLIRLVLAYITAAAVYQMQKIWLTH